MHAKADYHNMLSNAIQYLEKRDEYIAKMEGTRISKIERRFGEITSNQDFQDKCISYKKGCAIGFLPALQHSEYER